MNRYAALAGRIRANLVDIQRSVVRVNLLADKALQSGDDDYWDGVALNLHSFYTAIEHIFEDIGRTMETSLPSGSGWHLDLLLQMCWEVKSVRPAVISNATRDQLDAYRGFRHVVRNVYAFQLRPSRLKELAAGLTPCLQSVINDLDSFVHFLEQLD